MEAKAVVIEVSKSEKFGKVGRIVAETTSRFMADAMATGLQRMQYRGEFRNDVGYMYCDIDRIDSVSSSYGFKLEK